LAGFGAGWSAGGESPPVGSNEIGAAAGAAGLADASTFAGWSDLGFASAVAAGSWSGFGVAAGATVKAAGCKVGDAIDPASGSFAEADASFEAGVGEVGGVSVWVGIAGNATELIAGATGGAAATGGVTATGGDGGRMVAGALVGIGCGASSDLFSAGFGSAGRGVMVAVATGVCGLATEGQITGGGGATVSCGVRCAMTTFAATPTATA
jgi:hypothetical protein